MINGKIESYINANGEMIITPSGMSMWPMLRGKRDTVYVTKPQGRLKKYDLPVYKRSDGALVMHRVMEVLPDSYTMCGDHQTVLEHGITDKQIIAVVKGFYRDEKYISADNKKYMRYCRFWCASLKTRAAMLRILETAAFLKRCFFTRGN